MPLTAPPAAGDSVATPDLVRLKYDSVTLTSGEADGWGTGAGAAAGFEAQAATMVAAARENERARRMERSFCKTRGLDHNVIPLLDKRPVA